ncbi:MAG: hypothetical protein M0R06_05395 [Sphaerochaeta sp.]|jgi:hypothetical protein|nr:hypothetical protein [Sphaerochaeta sp.]
MAGSWFWIYGKSEGRPFRAGPYPSREKASSEGIRFCGADFEIFELPTRSTAEAGRMIKHQLATRAGSVGAGFQKHDLRDGEDSLQQIQEEGW